MSNNVKALKAYTDAALAVRDYKEKNKKVFEQYETLLGDVTEKQSKLKEAARDARSNFGNEFVRVTYSPAFRKSYDGAYIMEHVKPATRSLLLDRGVINYEVDKASFEEQVELGVVPLEVKVEAYKEQELSPRITIKENYAEQKKV